MSNIVLNNDDDVPADIHHFLTLPNASELKNKKTFVFPNKAVVSPEWNEKQGSEWEKVIVSELISDRTRFSEEPMKC